MQTKRRKWMLGVVVCSLLMAIPTGFVAAQAPAKPAPAASGTAAKPKLVKPAPPADPMAILKAIPANASAFVAVRNIAEIDYDVSDLLEKLNLPLENMGFPGLLTMIKERAGITDGFEANAGAAIVLLDCSQVKALDQMEKRAIILLPTTKAEALAKALGGNKQGDTFQLTLGGDPAIGIEKGGFLVIASSEAQDAMKEVAQAKEGVDKTLSPDRLKAFGTSDIFGWANPRGFSKELRAEPINMIKGLMMLGNPGAKSEDIDTSVSEITKFIEGLKEVSFGAALDAKVGLKLSFWYRAMPDSEIAKRLAALKLSDGSLLVGLPDEAVVLAGGAVNTAPPEDLRKALDQAIKPDMFGKEIDESKVKELKESIIKLASSVEQVAVSVTGLPSESQDGMLGFTLVVKTSNSQQAQAEIRKLFGTVKEMLLKLAVANQALTEEQTKALNEAVQLKENAEKVTGAVVDHFTVDLAKLPDLDAAKADEVKKVIGQEGIVIRIAAVGEKHVAITFGGGAKRFAQIVEQVQKNQAPLADRKTIKMIADRLPGQKRMMEGYFSIDRLLALVMDISSKMGQAMPIPLTMKETAPLAMVASQVDAGAVEVELLVPVETAQSVVEAIKPMMMMFMGGMPGQSGGMMAPEEEKDKEQETPAPATPPTVK
jgi:hypothetical protein